MEIWSFFKNFSRLGICHPAFSSMWSIVRILASVWLLPKKTTIWRLVTRDNAAFIFGPTKCFFLPRNPCFPQSQQMRFYSFNQKIHIYLFQLHKKAKKIRLPKLSQNRDHSKRKEEDEESQSGTNESVERIVTIDEDEEEDGSQAGTSSTSITNHLVGRDQQLDPQLLTLSGLAPSRWAGLPVLDLIRQRNKPKEPPKKAKSAPFFLPTIDTPGGFLFDKESIRNLMELDDGEDGASKRLIAVAERRLKGVALQSRWLQKLMR